MLPIRSDNVHQHHFNAIRMFFPDAQYDHLACEVGVHNERNFCNRRINGSDFDFHWVHIRSKFSFSTVFLRESKTGKRL